MVSFMQVCGFAYRVTPGPNRHKYKLTLKKWKSNSYLPAGHADMTYVSCHNIPMTRHSSDGDTQCPEKFYSKLGSGHQRAHNSTEVHNWVHVCEMWGPISCINLLIIQELPISFIHIRSWIIFISGYITVKIYLAVGFVTI